MNRKTYGTTHLLLFSLLFLTQLSFGQDKQYTQLSYAEIDSLTRRAYQKGDFDECLSMSQAATEKAIAEFGEKDSVYAIYMGHVGTFYMI